MTIVHINRPSGHFIGQIRKPYARRWQTVTGRCKSAGSAMGRAVERMHSVDHARVLFIDDSGWYEPHHVIEASR